RTSISQNVIVKPWGPHHLATRSGSAHAFQTSARGASKTRAMTSSRSTVSATALFLASMFLPLPLQLAQIVVQAIEALFPEATVALEPVGGVLQGRRVEAAGTPLSIATARHEAGALQHLQVLRDGGQAHVEGVGQLRDRRLTGAEAGEDRPPRGIR